VLALARSRAFEYVSCACVSVEEEDLVCRLPRLIRRQYKPRVNHELVRESREDFSPRKGLIRLRNSSLDKARSSVSHTLGFSNAILNSAGKLIWYAIRKPRRAQGLKNVKVSIA